MARANVVKTSIVDPRSPAIQEAVIAYELLRQARRNLRIPARRTTPDTKPRLDAEIQRLQDTGWENDKIQKARALMAKAEIVKKALSRWVETK